MYYMLITIDGEEFEKDKIVDWMVEGDETGDMPPDYGARSFHNLNFLKKHVEKMEEKHKHIYADNLTTCGAYICIECSHHVFKSNSEVSISEAVEKGWIQTLARCHCGWAEDGGDGIQQLVELGENID